MYCTVLLLTINSHHRAFRLVSSYSMHSSHVARIFNRHFCQLRLFSSIFMHCIDLPLIFNSHYAPDFFCFYAFCKSSSSSQQPLLHIPAPFCYFYAFFRPAFHSQQSLLRIEVYSGVFIHWTDLTIIVSSCKCPYYLHSCLLCIAPTLLSPSTVIFASQSSIIVVLCIPQTMLSLIRVISGHLSSSLFFYSHLLCIP